jgi:leucyl-tRNA synthetase
LAFAFKQRERIIKHNHGLQTVIIDWSEVSTDDREPLRQIYEILDLAKFDYERSQLNTIVSGCMKLLNILTKVSEQSINDVNQFIIWKGTSILLRLLSPIAPHMTHQLWHDLHYKETLLNATFPKVNAAALKIDQIQLVVQINGKLRTHIKVPSHADEKMIQQIATNDQKVKQVTSDKIIKKIITVPGRLVNIVTGEK